MAYVESATSCGHSQEELAGHADVERTYISHLERGLRNPAISTLIRVTAALDVRLSRFFTIAEQIQTGRLRVPPPPPRRRPRKRR